MTQYKTKDGQPIVVGGVYVTSNGTLFRCLAFKTDGQHAPVVGVDLKQDFESANAWVAECLTSLPVSEPEYDPAQMWLVYEEKLMSGYAEFCRVSSLEMARSFSKNISAFAIARVGEKFKRGDNL